MIERQAVVAAARNWMGTPYRHQASLKGVGCDCLGFVRGVWRDVYGAEPETVPAYAPGWAEGGRDERLLAAARRNCSEIGADGFAEGDLLLFRWRPHLPAKHAAIATSKSTMLHAQQGADVCEVMISNWWRRHMAAAFRFPGVET